MYSLHRSAAAAVVVFLQASDSSKPSFGSGPFSQSGFGSQSSGGFSSQGGSVMASGFGFGAPSTPGKLQ